MSYLGKFINYCNESGFLDLYNDSFEFHDVINPTTDKTITNILFINLDCIRLEYIEEIIPSPHNTRLYGNYLDEVYRCFDNNGFITFYHFEDDENIKYGILRPLDKIKTIFNLPHYIKDFNIKIVKNKTINIMEIKEITAI